MFPLPDIVKEPLCVLALLNIKLTCVDVDDVIFDNPAEPDVKPFATNTNEPLYGDIVELFPLPSLNVWSPMNTLEPVVAKEPVSIVEPLTSGITIPNVDASPFVNVKVFPLNEAVTNEDAVIAEVTYDDVAAIKLFTFASLDEVYELNEDVVVAPTSVKVLFSHC